MVEFDEERCKGCELCVNFCPRGLIRMAERFNSNGFHPAYVEDREACTGCCFCAIMCPEVAIQVYK